MEAEKRLTLVISGMIGFDSRVASDVLAGALNQNLNQNLLKRKKER